VLEETFVAGRDKGAWVNGRRLRVSRQKTATQALLATGFGYDVRDTGENVREWMECLARFQAVRRFGSAALDLACTAAGRFDGFWEYGLRPWDMAAGGLLVEEAGGVVTNLEGRPYRLGEPGILATSRVLQRPLLAALARARTRKLEWPRG
jgi:myo-inositol-1(or 4)-monophosphatase